MSFFLLMCMRRCNNDDKEFFLGLLSTLKNMNEVCWKKMKFKYLLHHQLREVTAIKFKSLLPKMCIQLSDR